MDLELAGRVAIVTGASRGVGKAIAQELALEGVDVAICARSRDALDAAAKELASATGRHMRCAKAVAPHMQERGWGRIINIGGLSVRRSEISAACGTPPSCI